MAVPHDNICDRVLQYPVIVPVVVEKSFFTENLDTELLVLHEAVFDIHAQATEHDCNKPVGKVRVGVVPGSERVIRLTLLYWFLQYSRSSGMEVVVSSSEDHPRAHMR
jgi:hypothetical protein